MEATSGGMAASPVQSLAGTWQGECGIATAFGFLKDARSVDFFF